MLINLGLFNDEGGGEDEDITDDGEETIDAVRWEGMISLICYRLILFTRILWALGE